MPADYGLKAINVNQTLDEAIISIYRIFTNTEYRLEIISDHDWLCHLVDNPSIMSLIRKLKIRGITIKIVVKITKHNTSYSKKLMKYSDVKHSDKIEGCTFRNERGYCFCQSSDDASSDLRDETESREKLTQFFYIDNIHFVNQQDFLFENLWHNSIPAREKMMQIEKGVIEIILNREPKSEMEIDSSTILFRILESCVDQILILIPATTLFWNIYKSDLLISISKILIKDVTIKILIHMEDGQTAIKDNIRYKLKELAQDLDINTNFFSKRIPQSHVSIIIDNVVLVEITYKDEKSVVSKSEINPITSFSINDTQVSSSTSIFDILWIQSDFERQKRIKQTYFDIFKGFNMKSENYNRDWNFEKKSGKKINKI